MIAKYDKEMDQKLNIQTCGFDESLEDFHHNRYEATPYFVLQRLAESGYIKTNHHFVDFGCGKGRVSIYINLLCGCTCSGIDYNAKLIKIAEKNKKRIGFDTQVRFIYQKAEEYTITNETCFYFFNPFSQAIFRSVLSNILASYYQNPRKMYLFFYYLDQDYMSCLLQMDELLCIDEISCHDLFDTYDERESIFVFEIV